MSAMLSALRSENLTRAYYGVDKKTTARSRSGGRHRVVLLPEATTYVTDGVKLLVMTSNLPPTRGVSAFENWVRSEAHFGPL